MPTSRAGRRLHNVLGTIGDMVTIGDAGVDSLSPDDPPPPPRFPDCIGEKCLTPGDLGSYTPPPGTGLEDLNHPPLSNEPVPSPVPSPLHPHLWTHGQTQPLELGTSKQRTRTPTLMLTQKIASRGTGVGMSASSAAASMVGEDLSAIVSASDGARCLEVQVSWSSCCSCTDLHSMYVE